MDIKETLFGPRRYLVLGKSISTNQITDKKMYEEAGKKLGKYIRENELSRSSGWSVLYFSWDKINKKAEIGIAVPINKFLAVEDPEIAFVEIPKCKASMNILQGRYEGLGTIHECLIKYIIKNGYDTDDITVMAVEEYVKDPLDDPDPKNWQTNVYYLHN